MGLIDDLTSTTATHSRFCAIDDILKRITPEEADALKTAIDRVRSDERFGRSKKYSCTWLAEVLGANGYSVSRSTVARHINGECACGTN